MISEQDYALQALNSFNVKSNSSTIYFPSSIDDLQQLAQLDAVTCGQFYILGEGSNSLFVQDKAPVIIKPKFTGISIQEGVDEYRVTVGASENWHQLVGFCINEGIYGLENLALIPGSVGAAPVQNIGAYGVEFADFCLKVDFFDFNTNSLVELSAQACDFSYRESIFKHELHNRGVITQVVLTFPKSWQAKLTYQGLDELPANASAKEVMQKVIKIRQSKLPDPNELPNAGSFFKNPVVSQSLFSQLHKQYPNMPHYPQASGEVKLAAGWLIDQLGLKGGRFLDVGVHQKQALVLVNYGQGAGKDVVGLAKYIQQQVFEHFAVTIEPEVRMIGELGEQAFNDLTDFSVVSELTHD